MILEKQYYLDLFRTSEKDLEIIAAEALRYGGEYSDLYFEDTKSTSLVLRDGKVSDAGLSNLHGVGIRVLKEEKTGYSYTESTDKKAVLEACKSAAMIAQGSRSLESPRKILSRAKDIASNYVESQSNGGRPIRKFFNGEPNPVADRYPILQDWRLSKVSEFVPYLLELEQLIKSKDQRIVKIIARLSYEISDILMFNSFKELKYDSRPLASVSVSVIFSQNGVIENNSVSRSYRMGAEMLTKELMEELANNAVKGIDQRFEAKRPKGGQMPVVMGAGASGILLHEAMGHAFEADFNRKGQSIFSDKLGKKICNSKINILDDATMKGNRGALNFDDEGVPGQRTYMVENGVLSSYLHDRISAKFYGVSPTGNGRRESFRYNPIPRMRNTYMEGGEGNKEDIISSVKKGIYVDEFSNGQVQIGEGDFTFYVKSGYLIENGRLTAPIKDINIIGNGPKVLEDIVEVADDLKIDNGRWTCGKMQSAPVSCGIPTVLIKSLTVGGDN